MRAFFRRCHWRVPTWHTLVHKGEHFFHTGYLTLVSIEAHGFYRYAAMASVGAIVASFFMHGEPS